MRASVQRAATAFADAVVRGRGIELRDLGLEMLVDQQQRLQRAADIAVAPRDDLVDRRFTRPETHSKPLPIVPAGSNSTDRFQTPVEDANEAGWHLLMHARQADKVPTVTIK